MGCVGGRYRSGVLLHRPPHGGGDLVPAGVWEADVQDGLVVVFGHAACSVHRLEHIGLDQVALAEDSYACAVPVEQIAVLRQLGEFDLGHVHQRVDLVFRPLEVLDAEGIYGDSVHARFVAYLEDLVLISMRGK